MAIESTKRAVERYESGRNVRAKCTAKPSAVIIVTNMEPMKLEICWTQRKIRDFRTTKLFQFLHHSERLPSINVSLVEEYIENYDPEDGSSVVQGRIIGIDETILEKNHNATDVIHEIGESSRTVVQGVVPVIEAGRVPSGVAMEEENQVLLLIDTNQLAFPEGRLPKGISLKNAVLKHISQIYCMISRIVEGQRDELIQNKKSWNLEREKFKCELQAEVDKTELLEIEKALLYDQLRCETGKMRSEIEVLQNEVSKLTEELTVRSQSQVSIEDVLEGMSPQEH
uniref:Predicted protein n=1 Tax=Physcomitrium patens TaxID=3218 RepID=A9U3G1_PHYPA